MPEGFVDAAAPVAHDDHGFGDAGHRTHPCGAGLAPGHVPADAVAAGPGDEHDRFVAQVDAVEVHHVVDLSVHRVRRPQAPASSLRRRRDRAGIGDSCCVCFDMRQSTSHVLVSRL